MSRASCLRSSRTALSSSSRTCCIVPSRLCRWSSSRRRWATRRARSSRPFCDWPPRRRNSRIARSGVYPAMTSSPMASSASARSTGGASGSPPSYFLKRVLSLAIDSLGSVGVLADLAREVKALERELDGAGPLTVVLGVEPVAHVVVQLGLTQYGKAREEIDRGDAVAGGDHPAVLDRVDEQRE